MCRAFCVSSFSIAFARLTFAVMEQEIRQYLKAGYFAQGVAILRRIPGVTAQQIRLYQQYLSRPYVPAAVEQQLNALLRSFLPPASEPSGEKKKKPPSVDPAVNAPFWSSLAQGRDLPDDILALHDRAIELHKRESLAHAQMGAAARAKKKKAAYMLAHEIMHDLRPALDELYDAVRAWQQTGQLPMRQATAPTAAAEVLELMKRLKYCNERVSRIKRWISDGFREKVVQGQNVKVLLDAKDVQALDNERLALLVEAKNIKEKLGI